MTEWKGIDSLLISTKKFFLSAAAQKEGIATAATNIIGANIKTASVKVKNEVVYFDVEPIVKNEIFLNKTKILEAIKIIYPDLKLIDIK